MLRLAQETYPILTSPSLPDSPTLASESGQRCSDFGAKSGCIEPRGAAMSSQGVDAANCLRLLLKRRLWATIAFWSVLALATSSPLSAADEGPQPPPPVPVATIDGVDFYHSHAEADAAEKASGAADRAVKRCDIDGPEGYDAVIQRARQRAEELREDAKKYLEDSAKAESNKGAKTKLIRANEAESDAQSWSDFADSLERSKFGKFEEYIKKCIIRSMFQWVQPKPKKDLKQKEDEVQKEFREYLEQQQKEEEEEERRQAEEQEKEKKSQDTEEKSQSEPDQKPIRTRRVSSVPPRSTLDRLLANCSYGGQTGCIGLPPEIAILGKIATDSPAYCSFGTARPSPMLFTPADEFGNPFPPPVAIGDDPPSGGQPPAGEKPRELRGDDNDNHLLGTHGPDQMTGGKGKDGFGFKFTRQTFSPDNTLDDGDRITDYESGEVIDLQFLLLPPKAVKLVYDPEKNETRIEIDVPSFDGTLDGETDRTIILNGDKRGELKVEGQACGGECDLTRLSIILPDEGKQPQSVEKTEPESDQSAPQSQPKSGSTQKSAQPGDTPHDELKSGETNTASNDAERPKAGEGAQPGSAVVEPGASQSKSEDTPESGGAKTTSQQTTLQGGAVVSPGASQSNPDPKKTGKKIGEGTVLEFYEPGPPPGFPIAGGPTTQPGGNTSGATETAVSIGQPPSAGSTPTETSETPSTPTNTPSSDTQVTLIFKVTEAVLKGQPTGSELKEEKLIKLVALEDPPLPTTGEREPEQDTGFDRSPVTCTTGTDGQCQADIPAEDRKIYGFPAGGARYYRTWTDLSMRRDSGVVIEDDGGPKTALPQVSDGAILTGSDFEVGDKAFTRVAIKAPASAVPAIIDTLRKVFGPRLQIDFCDEKKPGPPLGMEPASYSSLNRELPEATIWLGP